MADNNVAGYVYVLGNDSMRGILKIGYTTRSVDERLRELNASTSIPKPFRVVHYRESISPAEDERKVHAALFKYNHGKEFFKIGKETAINVIDQVMAPSIELARQRKEQLERERKARAEINEKNRLEGLRREQAAAHQKQREQARTAIVNQINLAQVRLTRGIEWGTVMFGSPFIYMLFLFPAFLIFIVITKVKLEGQELLLTYYIISVVIGYLSEQKELDQAAEELPMARQRLKEMDAGR